MDQMADEMTLRADVKDKGRVNADEDSSAWVRGERMQSEAQVSDWRLGACADSECAESNEESDARELDGCPPPRFSLRLYLRRSSSSSSSSSSDSMASTQQSNMGVDCAGIVLSCLFCRFSDMMAMLRDSCERAAAHCCPNYKQVMSTLDSASGNPSDSCLDLDCGLFKSCHDSGDCLELAMEMSELCYR